MSAETLLAFDFPAVGRKKVTAAFDGGGMTSDGGALLAAAAERRFGLARLLAALIADPRNPLPCFRSHQVPLAARQPGAPRAPHRRLLADAGAP